MLQSNPTHRQAASYSVNDLLNEMDEAGVFAKLFQRVREAGDSCRVLGSVVENAG